MHYIPSLVALSVLIAIATSYASFGLISRASDPDSNFSSVVWLAAGGISMGGGIWSMHFIGMLAMNTPFEITYDVTITIASLLMAIFFSMFAFMLLQYHKSRGGYFKEGMLLATGIAAMHYTGMASSTLQVFESVIGVVSYKHALVVSITVLVFLILSGGAIAVLLDKNISVNKKLVKVEQQFHQSQKMEAIGTLVGGIAHDFNNTLAAMTGNMYLAKKKMLEGRMEEVARNIENVEDLIQKAAQTIQHLLSFSRKGVMHMQTLSMRDLMIEALPMAKVSIPENIKVEQHIASDELWVYGDATQLQQALLNILNNARDAVESTASPRIVVRLDAFQADADFRQAYPDVDAERFAHLCVQDNGCGIAEADLQNIFEPFYTTKEVGKGTGLGLAMVYGAVQSHHGVIDIQSKPNEGTQVHVYLPLSASCPVEIAQATQGEQEEQGHGELILLADDEDDVREATAEVLQAFGYTVLEAQDGEQALRLFEQHADIALAMLDVVMPKMGGVQLAQALRSRNAQVPVIWMTGYDKDSVLKQGDTLAHSQVLTKPIDIQLLQQTLARLLRKVQ